MGSPTVLASQDILFDAASSAVSADGSGVHLQVRPEEAAGASEVQQPAALRREHAPRSSTWSNGRSPRPPASCTRTTNTVRTCSTASRQQLEAMKMKPAVTTYKRGASDFSAQAAKMKSDGCDLVVLGTVIRETIGLMAEAKKIGFAPVWLGATPVNIWKSPALGKELVEGLYAAAASSFPIRHRQVPSRNGAKPTSRSSMSSRTPGRHWLQRGHDLRPLRQLAGKDLTGQKMLDAMESGSVYQTSSGSPPTKFSRPITSPHRHPDSEVKNGRWVG